MPPKEPGGAPAGRTRRETAAALPQRTRPTLQGPAGGRPLSAGRVQRGAPALRTAGPACATQTRSSYLGGASCGRPRTPVRSCWGHARSQRLWSPSRQPSCACRATGQPRTPRLPRPGPPGPCALAATVGSHEHGTQRGTGTPRLAEGAPARRRCARVPGRRAGALGGGAAEMVPERRPGPPGVLSCQGSRPPSAPGASSRGRHGLNWMCPLRHCPTLSSLPATKAPAPQQALLCPLAPRALGLLVAEPSPARPRCQHCPHPRTRPAPDPECWAGGCPERCTSQCPSGDAALSPFTDVWQCRGAR